MREEASVGKQSGHIKALPGLRPQICDTPDGNHQSRENAPLNDERRCRRDRDARHRNSPSHNLAPWIVTKSESAVSGGTCPARNAVSRSACHLQELGPCPVHGTPRQPGWCHDRQTPRRPQESPGHDRVRVLDQKDAVGCVMSRIPGCLRQRSGSTPARQPGQSWIERARHSLYSAGDRVVSRRVVQEFLYGHVFSVGTKGYPQ